MKSNNIHPPKLAERLLLWFLKEELAEEVLGDLDEKFFSMHEKHTLKKARRNYWYQVLKYVRPFAFKNIRSNSKNAIMIQHNFKISFRQMLKSKSYSLINLGGLAFGMVVTMLIGLWVYDELSYNQNHENYPHIAQLLRQETNSDEYFTSTFLTTGMGTMIREQFPDQIERVVMVRGRRQDRVLSHGDLKFRDIGIFLETEGPEMLGLDMKFGVQNGLDDINSVMLSETMSEKFFGDRNPVGELLKLDANRELKVTGVYRDLPKNSSFSDARFFSRLVILFGGNQDLLNVWDNYNVSIYVQLHPEADLGNISQLVSKSLTDRLGEAAERRKTRFVLHPMKDWHLNSEWVDGQLVTSSQMKFVWLYGIIGGFVLILACINFMNLSTARSERRAKEVGIRKTLGSVRRQLIAQFYMESFLYSLLSFAIALLLLKALLPWFNATSGKEIAEPWSVGGFWLLSLAAVFTTSLLAGSYPAAFLSSFNPIKALKGSFSAGKKALIPRKVLVVFQFTISIALIAGTITVNNQIQAAKNRPIGYSPKGMISLRPASPNFREKYETMKVELMRTGMVSAVGTSDYPVISTLGWNGGFSWEGMDPQFSESFNTISISEDYAEAVGMEFIHGRDFDRSIQSDTRSIIINRSAMEAMQLKDPVGKIITWAPGFIEPARYAIVGLVEDMIKGSPFQQTDQSVMFNSTLFNNWLYIRLNPEVNAQQAIASVEKVFNNFLPEAPFDFHFADDDYNEKFEAEVRIGKLAGFFSILAIFISCLGLFGMASYVAEQRTKEIGIRKVLGAKVFNLWKLLSRDFAILVSIACFISIPIAYYVLDGWLSTYEVQARLSWWIFAAAGFGALAITMVVVSFQAIKAATANPVKSLRMD